MKKNKYSNELLTIKDKLLGDIIIGPHDVEICVKMKKGRKKNYKVKIYWETLYGIQQQFGYDISPFVSDGYKKCLYEILEKSKS